VVSLSISLIAVFIPLLFMSGIVGRLFREFAITLSCSVIVSAVVSLTLTPMMCSRMLRREHKREETGISRFLEHAFEKLLWQYDRSLLWVLRHQKSTFLVAIATLVATAGLFMMIPKGLLPIQDTGLIIGVTDASQDISFKDMLDRQKRLSEVLANDPDVLRVAAFVGTGPVNPTQNSGRLYLVLKPRERRSSVRAIMSRLSAAALQVPGISLYLQPSQDLQIDTRISRTQFQYLLQDVDP